MLADHYGEGDLNSSNPYGWKQALIRNLFEPSSADAILNISISIEQSNLPDIPR